MRNQRSLLPRLALVCGPLLLTGCQLGPDYQRPERVQALVEGGYVHAPETHASELVPLASESRWWEQLGDPTTTALVARALENNLDILSAQYSVEESAAALRSAGASRGPDIRLSGDVSRTRSDASGQSASEQSASSAGLFVSWQTDLFGRLKASEQQAQLGHAATLADRRALQHLIIASVVRARVDYSINLRRLRLAEEVLQSREQSLATVERRFDTGLPNTNAVDVHLSRENLAAAEADLVAREQSVALGEHALSVLLGQRPGNLGYSRTELELTPTIAPPPTGVPADLLDRRPDLSAQEARTMAANLGISIAMADLYPNLRLTGSLSAQSADTFPLDAPTTILTTLAASVSQLLFDGGRTRAEIERSEAHANRLAVQYASATLAAVREVEDALVNEQKTAARSVAVERQAIEAQAAESRARDRYDQGLANLLTVLDSERRRRSSEDLALQLMGQRWKAGIDLYLALGGAWLRAGTDK